MAKKRGICANCGADYTLWPKNRKYCGACQALRDLDFRPGMSRKCDMCDAVFYPFRTGHTRCYECSNFRPIRPDEFPVCESCGQHKRTAPGLENHCVSCVQKDSAAQALYHRSLKRIVRQRIAAKEAV